MDQKEFEERLDGMAERLSKTMTDGVRKMEDAFERGKENVRRDMDGQPERGRLIGSPRMGLILLIAGLIWLAQSMGWLAHSVFPVILIAAGLFFILRNR